MSTAADRALTIGRVIDVKKAGMKKAVMRDEDDESSFAQWASLINARNALEPDDPMQNVLGPREHGAYAEMRVDDYPVYGVLEQLLAIPAYTAAKKLGIMGGRSQPSIDEMAEAYRGVGRGIRRNFLELF